MAKRRARSTRVRILAWVLVPVLVALVVSWVAAWALLQQRLNERIDTELAGEVAELRLLADEGVDPHTGEPFQDVATLLDLQIERSIPDPNETMFVIVDGQVRTRSSDTPPVRLDRVPAFVDSVADVDQTTFGSLSTTAGAVRYVAVPVIGGGQHGVFVVAIFADREGADLAQVMSRFAAVGVVVLLLAAGVAWLVAGRLLAPLRQMGVTAKAISDTDLTRRIAVDPARGGDDVADLARTFNDMLDRLQAAFASQRAFIDDAGHELRTPLTIARGHLELLDDDPVQRAQTIALVLSELDRMGRLVHDLQTLTSAGQPGFLHPEAVAVSLLLDEIVVKAQALGPRRWSVHDESDNAEIVLDPHRITQAMLQLVTNAVALTTAGDPIAIGVGVHRDTMVWWVADSGPGIPAAERAVVTQRFARGAGSRHDGSGLGLAVVHAIVTAHGGRLTIADSPLGGARLELWLPVVRAPVSVGGRS